MSKTPNKLPPKHRTKRVENTEQITAKTPNKMCKKHRIDLRNSFICSNLQGIIKEHNKTGHQTPIREPDLLLVLTGGQYAYRRKDGVYVVPVGCLRD